MNIIEKVNYSFGFNCFYNHVFLIPKTSFEKYKIRFSISKYC